MKEHSLNLHSNLPGTLLAKGMINDTNKNFVEECILKQNKINTNSATLDIYKLTNELLHHSYPTSSNNTPSTTTLYREIMNGPATIQLEQTNLTVKEGKFFLVYHSHLRGRAMAHLHKIQMRAQHTPPEKLFNGHTPELGRRQQRQLPGFYTSSPIQQKNYLSALMGNRENTSTVDRSLGPRTSRVKSPRHTINLDTSSDDFPNLPHHKTKHAKTHPPPSMSTITPDQSELQTIKQQLDIITKSHEAIITMQKQLQAQIDTQNKILDKLIRQSQQSQTITHTSISPSSLETPPVERN